MKSYKHDLTEKESSYYYYNAPWMTDDYYIYLTQLIIEEPILDIISMTIHKLTIMRLL